MFNFFIDFHPMSYDAKKPAIMNYIRNKIIKDEFNFEDAKILSPADLEICMNVQNRLKNKRYYEEMTLRNKVDPRAVFLSQTAKYQSPSSPPNKATRRGAISRILRNAPII